MNDFIKTNIPSKLSNGSSNNGSKNNLQWFRLKHCIEMKQVSNIKLQFCNDVDLTIFCKQLYFFTSWQLLDIFFNYTSNRLTNYKNSFRILQTSNFYYSKSQLLSNFYLWFYLKITGCIPALPPLKKTTIE